VGETRKLLAEANLVVEDYEKIKSALLFGSGEGEGRVGEPVSIIVAQLIESLQTCARELAQARRGGLTVGSWQAKYEKAAKELADVTNACMGAVSGNDDRPLSDIINGLSRELQDNVAAKFKLQRTLAELLGSTVSQGVHDEALRLARQGGWDEACAWVRARSLVMPGQMPKLPPEVVDGRCAPLVKQEVVENDKLVCSGCKGYEQVWGVRWTDGKDKGWMGYSAFLDWTGTKEEARAAATKWNLKSPSAECVYAEQLTCPKCGKTNSPARVA
jgi:hypothetical protein